MGAREREQQMSAISWPALAGVGIAVLAGTLAPARADELADAARTPSRPGWTARVDEVGRFRVEVPPGWKVVTDRTGRASELRLEHEDLALEMRFRSLELG